jgi:hypothetical protein
MSTQNKDKSTPLHLAASSRLALKGTIMRLLRHGANVDATDSESHTPLGFASSAGNSWIAKLLSDHLMRRWLGTVCIVTYLFLGYRKVLWIFDANVDWNRSSYEIVA